MRESEKDESGWQTRTYDTEDQARQAWDDMASDGTDCTFSAQGGDSDGTGGTYELEFRKHED
jgi:hypothetical protein